jgi:hypothetical protein
VIIILEACLFGFLWNHATLPAAFDLSPAEVFEAVFAERVAALAKCQ